MVPFVGRQSELAVLRACLAEALAGRPQIVQIQGPAGIGKTALLEHFLAESREATAPVVVWASGEESEELLAYGVVEQLARSTMVAAVDTPLLDVLSAHRADPFGRPGHRRHPIAGIPRPARWSRGDPRGSGRSS